MAASKAHNQTMMQFIPPRRVKRRRVQYHSLEPISPNTRLLTASLPDDVIEHILSFLSVKNAMRFALLSSRFKKSWRLTQKLHFDREFSSQYSTIEYIATVNSIFHLHAGPKIRSLQLHFDPTGEGALIESWLKMASQKGIEVLDLDFYSGSVIFKLPYQWLEIETLKILKLCFCQFDFPPKLNGLGFLSTVVLRKMNIASTLIDSLLSNCLCLESLDMATCYLSESLKINSPTLKRFKVLKFGDILDVTYIEINAPSLTTIFYFGHIHVFNFATDSNLKDALFNFKPSKTFTQSFRAVKLVNDLSRIQVLSITSTFLEGLSRRFVCGEMREVQFSFWRLKELQLFMAGAIYCNIFDVVSFLKNCPRIERLFIDLTDFAFEGGDYWKFHHEEAFENCCAFFTNLEFIKLTAFKFQKYELMLLKFIMERAMRLERIVLVTPRSRRRGLAPDLFIYVQYLQYYRASKGARIDLYEYHNDQSFVYPVHPKIWF